MSAGRVWLCARADQIALSARREWANIGDAEIWINSGGHGDDRLAAWNGARGGLAVVARAARGWIEALSPAPDLGF